MNSAMSNGSMAAIEADTAEALESEAAKTSDVQLRVASNGAASSSAEPDYETSDYMGDSEGPWAILVTEKVGI